MNPKISFSGLALFVLLNTGCNSDTAPSEENTDPVLEEFPVVYIERSLDTDPSEEINQAASFPILNPLNSILGQN